MKKLTPRLRFALAYPLTGGGADGPAKPAPWPLLEWGIAERGRRRGVGERAYSMRILGARA